jgi:hypothetical protein
MVTENYIEHVASGHSGHGSNGESDDGDGPLALFIDAMKSKRTETQSLIRLDYYFNFLNIPGDSLEVQASNFVAQIG